MKIEEKKGVFQITEFNEAEAYTIACKIENDGIWFYGKLLRREKDAGVKKQLQFLLEEEQKHLKFFQERLYELSVQEGAADEDDGVLSSMDFGVFEPYQSIEDLESALSDAKRALALGVAVEDKSIRFYQACARQVSSEAVREELTRIATEENRHKELFQRLLHAAG
jgi:rubrerythrin